MITFEAHGRWYKIWWRFQLHPHRHTHEITDCYIAPYEPSLGKYGQYCWTGRVTRDSRDPDNKEIARKRSLKRALQELDKRSRSHAWAAYFAR